MGYSAKITRGGNKKRINQKRQEAKLRAQGASSHTTTVKDGAEAKRFMKEKSKAIAGELKAQTGVTSSSGTCVRMLSRSQPSKTN